MHKLIASICITLMLSSALAADACSGAASLRATFNLTNKLTAPAVVPNLPYCESLMGLPICCTYDQVNSFQDMTNTVLDNLASAVADRDLYFASLGDPEVALENALTSFIDAMVDFESQLLSYAMTANTAYDMQQSEASTATSDSANIGDALTQIGSVFVDSDGVNSEIINSELINNIGYAFGSEIDSVYGSEVGGLLASDGYLSSMFDSFSADDFTTMGNIINSLNQTQLQSLTDLLNNFTSADYSKLSQYYSIFGANYSNDVSAGVYMLELLDYASGDYAQGKSNATAFAQNFAIFNQSGDFGSANLTALYDVIIDANFSLIGQGDQGLNYTTLAMVVSALEGTNVTASDISSLFDAFASVAEDPTTMESMLGLFLYSSAGSDSGSYSYFGYGAGSSDGLDASESDGSSMVDMFMNISSIVDEMGDALDNITITFDEYQSYRSTCVVELIKIQAAAWCLSCDPNATTNGWDSLTKQISMSSDVCGRLKGACYDYISNADIQNVVLNITRLIATMDAVTAAFTAGTGQELFTQGYNYTGEFLPANLPANCTSQDNCDWICQGLFNNGNINMDNLAAGGVLQAAATKSAGRRLFEVDDESRVLAATNTSSSKNTTTTTTTTAKPAAAKSSNSSSTSSNSTSKSATKSSKFNPSDNEAGTSVAFSKDPGNANKAKSSGMMSYGSVVIATVMAVVSMML